MKISKYKHYIKNRDGETRKESLNIANALFAELINYGIIADDEIIGRISRLKPRKAAKVCAEIAAEYVAPNLNPPLFKNWEERTFFSLGEFIVQIYGYIFQFSGNDLQNENFTRNLKKNIDFKKFKFLSLASDEEVREYALNLFGANVSQDKATAQKLVKAAKYLDFKFFGDIKSDEARTAAVLGLSKKNSLCDTLTQLKCKPADVLRFAAGKNDFDLVKLPHDVKYSNLSWRERVDSLSFLSKFDFEYLNEAMGMNRGAWNKYFKHIHLQGQKGFANRFKDVCLANFVSEGNRLEKAPEAFAPDIKKLIKKKIVEVTDGGTLAYRTFASRIQSAIESKDFEAIQELGNQRPNYILRNLTSVANGISKKDDARFVKFVKSLLKNASPDVLFSILSIDVTAKWRIIDVKGDTRVEAADYNQVIAEIQDNIESEIKRRWGYAGKVDVQGALKDNIVPFLAKNTNLARGTKFSVENKDYLYFFCHWIQKGGRTDIDTSYLAFDKNWNAEMVWFGQQANSYIAHSGDITNAPAPNGATEYGKISLNKIPAKVKYIVPVINVFSGDNFADNQEVKAGFFGSDEDKFCLTRKHNTFDLNQPASANFPFVFDVEKGEVLLLDVNIRDGGYSFRGSAHQFAGTIKNMIEATKTKNYITIEKLAKILSGKGKEISLTITNKAENANEITPESLFSIFS
jgi:stress response protein SCP2